MIRSMHGRLNENGALEAQELRQALEGLHWRFWRREIAVV
jgi:hypothetical protein